MTSAARASRSVPIPLAIVLVSLALLSLRGPFGVTMDVLRHAGSIDHTLVAYLSTFGMIVAGIPGLVVVVAGGRIVSATARTIAIVSLLSLLVGCIASLLWIGASIRMIGGTLSPAQIAAGVLPPVVTAIAAIWARFRI